MPMFGSMSGCKAGMSGTSDQTGEGALKGARSKEGADQGAMSPDPQNDATLRELSPHQSPPGLQNTRDRFTLLFGVQVTPLLGNGTESPVLPPYAWNERIITDTLSPSIDGIMQVIVLNPVECFVFKGRQSRGEGFSLEEATGIAAQLHRSYDHWIGRRIRMCCIPHTLKDVCTELKVTRESVREMNVERLGTACSAARKQPTSQWDSEYSRGYIRQSDQYFASQYLSQEKRERDRCEEEEHSCRGYQETWTDAADTRWFDARDSPIGSYAPAEGTECWRGPEEVPQALRDAFHSAQEEQSDSVPEYVLEDSGDESDDIVAYDTETSCYTTIADRERQEKRDRCHANCWPRKERHHDPRHCQKKLNLPIFRDSTSDNAITYDDWRCDVDNCVREGHSTTLIRDSSLEGRPCRTAMTAIEDGDGSLKSIMTALDQVYGGATTYTTLLHKLNSIQQAHGELAKDYYERVVQIRVKLQEFHCYMFRPGDLEHQAKEAFFNGLCPEFQSMVVHKRDDPSVSITKLLITMRECEENQENNRHNRRAEYAKTYPPSTTRKDTYRDQDQNTRLNTAPQNQGQSCYRQDNQNIPVTVHALCPEPDVHMQHARLFATLRQL